MVPARDVVARPHGRVALHAGVARARQHEGSLAGPELLQPFKGRARHLHPVDVVVARVRARPSVARVLRAEREGLHRVMIGVRLRRLVGEEDAGLVHVVPETRDAFVQVLFVERAEPLARLRVGEVGEGADAGPHARVQLAPVGVLDEVPARLSLFVREVVRVNLDAGVDDDDGAEAFGAQVGDQLRGVGEVLAVPREDAEAVHVVDVEVDDIGGNL